MTRRPTLMLMLARLPLLWERLAPVWMPWLLAALATAALGVWTARLPLQGLWLPALLLAPFAAALAFSLRGLWRLRLPGRGEAEHRLTADNRLVHRPFRTLSDTLATGDADLWDLHHIQTRASLTRLRLARPRAALAEADPLALRYALTLGLVLGLRANGPAAVQDARSAFRPAEALAVQASAVIGTVGAELARSAQALAAQSSAAMAGNPRIRPAESRP